MSMFKRTKVVMLSTNEKAQDILFFNRITLKQDGKLIYGNPVGRTEKAQHLYFLSDEDIKEDDYVLVLESGFIIKNTDTSLDGASEKWKKIIATTDKSLDTWRESYVGIPPKKSNVKFPNEQLPKPSMSFINKFIEEYNKGNLITEVLIEYEELADDDMMNHQLDPEIEENWLKLKVNPKDNTITIKPTKQTWTKEELPLAELESLKSILNSPMWKRDFEKNDTIFNDCMKGLLKWTENNL